jgi:2,5-diketo-D-gluconate reductase B
MDQLSKIKIGLGTWRLSGNLCRKIVLDALDLGYKLIDTAQMYGNEENIGDAIETTSVPRKTFILETKIEPSNLSAKRIHSSFKESMHKLKTDYIDVLYVHWPNGRYKPGESLPAMDELVENGTVRKIGISNFPIALVQKATEISENVIANQVEMHPALRQKKLHAYNTSKKLFTVAYSPFAKGQILNNSILKKIAEKHQISVAQVSLAYLTQRNAIPIPKSGSIEHLKENLEALKYRLDDEDISDIDRIPENRVVNFGNVKWDVDD